MTKVALFSVILALAACHSQSDKAAVQSENAQDAVAEFAGIALEPIALKASDGSKLVVSANKKFEGRPDGFYKMFLTNLEVVIERDAKSAAAVFVAECKDYEGRGWETSVTCKAEARDGKLVARLDLLSESCTRNAENAGYLFRGKDWYLNGREGYYAATSCTPKMAVVVDGTWLKDPVTQGSNFGLGFDLGYEPKAEVRTAR